MNMLTYDNIYLSIHSRNAMTMKQETATISHSFKCFDLSYVAILKFLKSIFINTKLWLSLTNLGKPKMVKTCLFLKGIQAIYACVKEVKTNMAYSQSFHRIQ